MPFPLPAPGTYTPLSIDELTPGKLYIVTEVGSADECFKGSVVRAVQHDDYAAIGVAKYNDADLGMSWREARWFGPDQGDPDNDPDMDARFAPFTPPKD